MDKKVRVYSTPACPWCIRTKQFLKENEAVTDCATCDAPLFSAKDVAVIGGGNSALDATLQLMNIAKHIYVINITAKLGTDAVMREKVEESKMVTVFAKDIEKNQYGEIKVNFRNETNIPGIFAAGDVTDVPEKQIIIAAGEGSKACLSAFRYLAERRFQ